MRRLVVTLAAVVAAVVAVNVGVSRARVGWDLTEERSATLSDESLRVLSAVHRPVRLTAFFARDDLGRVSAATLLNRYRRANHRVSWRILDPAVAAGEAVRLGVPTSGSVAVERGRDVELAQDAIEIDITSAIARLVRGRSGTICFAIGHGEPSIDDTGPRGLATVSGVLHGNAYALRSVDLLAGEPLDGCDALVLAAPQAALGEVVAGAVKAYLRASGKALVLGDARPPVDLSAITGDWGITFTSGIVEEGDPSSRVANDPTAPIVSRYYAANPAVRGLPETFFPGAQAVAVQPVEGRPSLSTGPVAATSPSAYLERGGDEGVLDPDIDVPGPIGVGAAADDSSVEGAQGPRPRINRTRLFALGDVDFATNAYVRQGGNARLVLQAVDWLTQPEPLVSAVPHFPKLRELRLTEARSRYILFLTTGVVPGLFLLAGAMVWAVRRGR
jgi:hypothetical protein